jgi:hypothetical protein
MSRIIGVLSLTVLSLTGCKTDEQCERLRMDLAKAWGGLRESAAKRKLAGVDVEGWTKVEQRTELLESSFMTPRVTWQSADKARTELTEILRGRQTDTQANLTGYLLSVEAASKQQQAYSDRCR